MLTDVLRVLQRLSEQPVLAGEIALVAAILYGAGKAAGVPLLFWHERQGIQVIAGASVALFVGEVLLVTYLLAGAAAFPGHAGLERFFLAGGVFWAGLVLVRAGVLVLMARTPREPAPEQAVQRAQRPEQEPERPVAGLTPAIAQYDGATMQRLTTSRIYPWGFLIGTALGGAGVAGLIRFSGWLEGQRFDLGGCRRSSAKRIPGNTSWRSARFRWCWWPT